MSQEYTPVFHYNFTKSFNISDFEHKIVHDAHMSRDPRGLSIHSPQYNAHVSPGMNGLLDHIKSLTFLCQSYNSQHSQRGTFEGEFIYEACISAQQIISPEIVPTIYRNRIRNIYEDYRLCSSGLVVYDEESMITAKILFTNSWIYGYYERRPGYKTNWIDTTGTSDYAAFASIIPLCKRGSFDPTCQEGVLDDYVRVGIGVDSCKGTIKFYINRTEMFCVNKIGYRLDDRYQVTEYGGTPYLTVLGCLRFGFGHFSYLDHNIPNNYARQYMIEVLDTNGYPIYRSSSALAQLLPTNKYKEPYPDFIGDHKPIEQSSYFAYSGSDKSFFNFGQGMITRIKYIAGYIVKNQIKMYKKPYTKESYSQSSDTPSGNDTETLIYGTSTKKYFLSDDPSGNDTETLIYGTSTKKHFVSDSDLYGPIPEPSLNVSNSRRKHQSDSMRALFMKPNNLPEKSHVPLYRDLSNNKSNTDVSSYSLSDLYKRSQTRRFITKGETDVEQESEKGNDECKIEIRFSSNDMTLYI